VNRRRYLNALAALGGTPFQDTALMADHTHTNTADEVPGLPPLTLVEHDYNWLNGQLAEFFGEGPWQGWPGSGIYHLSSDVGARVPTSKAAIRQRADAVVELPQPDYEYNEFDCEDYAIHLYSTLTKMYPRLSVGVAFTFTGDHAFNVFVTEDGVMEYEPQGGTVVTDSDEQLYEFDRGLLFI